jgi:hypothetical protein
MNPTRFDSQNGALIRCRVGAGSLPPPPTDPYGTNSVLRFVSNGHCWPRTSQLMTPQGDMTVAAHPSTTPCAGVGSFAGRVHQPTPGCWLRRSPLLRRSLRRRREALPSSRVTLLPPCPALRPRWCPAHLPWREQDCCLPSDAHCRLSARLPGLIPLSTTIRFSAFNSAAWVLASPLLRHRLSAIVLRFGYRPGG